MTNLININAPSVEIDATDTTSNVELGVTSGSTILVDNSLSSSSDCYVKSGYSDVVATTDDMRIASGEKSSYGVSQSHTHVAVICGSGDTTTLRIARGGGI